MSHQAYSCNKRKRETINKASSSSPFRSNKLGCRDAQVIRRERPRSYPHSVGDHDVVGIEEDVQKLVQHLMDPQSRNFLGIVGMGGSGKTTLARQIYNHEKIKKYFDRRAWVCVSQVWSEDSILKEIFSQTTGQNSNNLTPTQMVQEIHKLLEGKSYLVVLDDVWEPDALMKTMVPTGKLHGSKFVITTRNQKVIQFSDLRFEEHNPRRLTHDQSLELFRKIAFDDQSNSIMAQRNGPFVDLVKKMLYKCDGLPLAVISLAGLLRTKKTIQEWNKISENVSSKIIKDQVGPSDYGRVEEMLGLSYSDLNYTMKSCFMYLSLFREDVEIHCGMLMRCWIAEGFFKSVWLERDESVEDVARQCLDELIQRCLVQVVRVNYAGIAHLIKVHDLLRDLAAEKAKVNYFSTTLPPNPSPRPIMQCLRLCMNRIASRDGEKIFEDLGVCLNLNLTPTLNQDKVSRRLRSFIDWPFTHWSAIEEYPYNWLGIHFETFLTNYSWLRVLIIDDEVENIPDVIGSLIHLRYLQLTCQPYLPDSIQNLRNLLSFDCRSNRGWSKPMSIPNLKQMQQLRYLRLPLKHHVKTVYTYEGPVHLCDLRNVKVLRGIKSGKWMITELKYLSPTVEKLEIIQIESSKELEQVYECPSIVEDHLRSLSLSLDLSNAIKFKMQKLQHCTNLQKLYLHGFIKTTDVPLVFPPNLLKLRLSKSLICDQESFANALQGLTCLKFLYLAGDAYMSADLTFPANSLLELETLHILYLEGVERIIVMEGAMPDLKSFIVDYCGSLKVIPQRFRHILSRKDWDTVSEESGSDYWEDDDSELGSHDLSENIIV